MAARPHHARRYHGAGADNPGTSWKGDVLVLSRSVLDTIGNTPLVALDRLAADVPARIAAKLEYYGPGGSIKDRAALFAIEAAERSGRLRPGGTVVELTSGNMGIGLSVVCVVKGYQMTAVMSVGNSVERRRVLEGLGARIELVPQAPGSVPGQVSREDLGLVEVRAAQLTRELNAFRPDQFNNPACVDAHDASTGQEIWRQTDGSVTAFLAAPGTGGTFVGVARALKRHNPAIRCYAVEPASAPVISGGPITSTSHKLQGAGYATVPPLWDPALCDGAFAITDDDAIATARLLATREGIFGGFTGGANVAAALQLSPRLTDRDVIVTIVPDTGLKYLSTDLYA